MVGEWAGAEGVRGEANGGDGVAGGSAVGCFNACKMNNSRVYEVLKGWRAPMQRFQPQLLVLCSSTLDRYRQCS